MNSLRIVTLISHFFIAVFAGHGMGFLIFIEYMSIVELLFGKFQFNLNGEYSDRFMTVGLISIVGQGILIVSFLVKGKLKSKITILGCVILLLTIFILTYGAKFMNLEMISLIFGIPFIILSSQLLIKEIRQLRN